MELLRQLPQTQFYTGDLAQQIRMLDHIGAPQPGETICIAEYASTLHVFSKALIERKNVRVEVYIRVDLRWCRSNEGALKVIRNLQAAGIDVKHLRGKRMHFKLVIVGMAYAAGGSANLSKDAFTSNADYVTEVLGYSEAVTSARAIFDEQYNGEKAKVARENEVIAALAHLAAKRAALEAEKAAGQKHKRSNPCYNPLDSQ
ncbi:hypothetical protein PHYBOEH_005407 [Phytophthora boehmeriae]|uniref:Phospholipase D-like domain-containing protein n=1 Tax=Phytophthora boehmeriae TaxID=109152 RepID=A0A8T1WLU5_9STRA|nr:hypothetical protein PHYBOEH_005407 [Phytophthora boehmeriae]